MSREKSLTKAAENQTQQQRERFLAHRLSNFQVGRSIGTDSWDFRVFEGLLHAIAHRVVVVFGFRDCQGKMRFVGEDIVGFLRFTAGDCLASNGDSAFGEVEFFTDLGHNVPFVAVRADKCRRNVLGADIRFGELLFVHAARARTNGGGRLSSCWYLRGSDGGKS